MKRNCARFAISANRPLQLHVEEWA